MSQRPSVSVCILVFDATSAGIHAGIDRCLHLVARLGGRELAQLTARQMDYHGSFED